MDYSAYLRGLRYLVPEMVLLAAAVIALLVHLFMRKKGRRLSGIVSLLGLLAGLYIILIYSPLSNGEIFSGNLLIDRFALYFKMIFPIAGILTILLCFKFFDVERFEPGEVYPLILLAIIGMMTAVSSVDLIASFVSFELFAVSSYILAGIFKKEKRSAEAGLKYFILGTLSSAIMLLGMVIIFGLSGETNYLEISKHMAGANREIALIGMVLFLAGLFLKAALAPFHMWAPDVYEGAPTPLVAFLSTAPKAAIFAIIIRLLSSMFTRFESQWSIIFQVIAVITMFWGNIAALIQTNIKRMMAYSSIAHAGYIAIGLAAWGQLGSLAVLFYLFIYVFMNAAAFGMILLLGKGHGFGEEIDDMRGLARKSPLAAAGIVILLLSLTGIPPTAGFFGKYFLFAAAVEKGMVYLAVLGALNSVISLFFYFRIGKAMFMEHDAPGIMIDKSFYVKSVLLISALVILVLGILPSAFTTFVSASALK